MVAITVATNVTIRTGAQGVKGSPGGSVPHAPDHEVGGSDVITVEDLATAGTIGQVPTSDGAGALTMQANASGNVSSPGGESAGFLAEFTGSSAIGTTTITSASVVTHLASTANPHSVTAGQAGADPAGTATAAVSAHDIDTGAHANLPVENLATAGTSGQVPTSDGAGNLVMTTPVTGVTAHSALTGLTVGDDHTQYQLRTEKNAANGYPGLSAGTKLDGAQQTYGALANTATEGNDSRVPTQGENDALVGTNGVPATGNPYVTDSDPRNTNARTPTVHANTHEDGQSDAITGAALETTITPAPTNYTPTANTIKGQFGGVDNDLGTLLKLDGTRKMTGDFDVDGNDIQGGITLGGTLAGVGLFDYVDEVGSVGFFGDPAGLITASGINFDVAAGIGSFHTLATVNSPLGLGDWPAALANLIPLDSIRYVGVEWNAGTPQVVIKTTNVWTLIQEWPLGTVTRDADGVHPTPVPIRLSNFASLIDQRISETDPFARANGLNLGNTLLTVQRTAGRGWLVTTPQDFALFNSGASDTFDRYFQDSPSGFNVQLNQTSFEDQSFENGSGTLGVLTNNRFGVRWFYMDIQTGGLSMMYGTSNTNDIAIALNEEPPADLPPRLQVGNILLGRYVFVKSGGVAIDVADIWGTTFSSGGGGDGDVTGPAGGTVADEVTVFADTGGKAIAGSGGLLSANLAVLDATRTFSKVVQSQATDDTTVVHTLTNTGTNPGQSDELVGDRNPEGLVTAEPGTRYHRQDGVDSTDYILKSAATANTPWIEVGSDMSAGVAEIQVGLDGASAAVAIGGTPTSVAMDFSAVTFDATVYTFATNDTDVTVDVSGRYEIILDGSVTSTSAGTSIILAEIFNNGSPLTNARSQTAVENSTISANGFTVTRIADLTAGNVVGPRFTQTAGAGAASIDPGSLRFSLKFFSGSIAGAVSRKTDFGLGIPAPHAIDTNSATPWKVDGAGQVTEIELVALLDTEGASGSFTVEFFFGPDGGPFTSIGSATILQGTLSGSFTPGSPVAYPAGSTFKCDRTAIGAFPGGTSEDKQRMTAIFRTEIS
jgi:hypothetical protein